MELHETLRGAYKRANGSPRAVRSCAAAVACLMILHGTAGAQPLADYRCLIERIATIEPPPNKMQAFEERTYVGKEFTVERRTGLMVGTLKNAYITRPQVIDPGSQENSFKVVTTLRLGEQGAVGSNVYVLVVKEYETGPRKPFVFLQNDVTYFGSCRHF